MKMKDVIEDMFKQEKEVWIADIECWVSKREFAEGIKEAIDWGRKDTSPYFIALERHREIMELGDFTGLDLLTKKDEALVKNEETKDSCGFDLLTDEEKAFAKAFEGYIASNPLSRLSLKNMDCYLHVWRAYMESKRTGESAFSVFSRARPVDLTKQAFSKKMERIRKISAIPRV